MKLFFPSLVFASLLLSATCVSSQGTDLGGGIVTRSDVEYLADLTLDVRDIKQQISGIGGGVTAALATYTDGRNAEKVQGVKYKLSQLSTDMASQGLVKATPNYLFHLYGLAGRSVEHLKLSEQLNYADNYLRTALMAGRQHAPDAILVLSIWMYATYKLYDGVETCQKLVEADNPSQLDLGTAGLDELIALWIGTGQTQGSSEGNGLYALTEEADALFFHGDDGIDNNSGSNIVESLVNKNIKLLYQEGSGLVSNPDFCTRDTPDSPRKLWSVVQRIISQMHVPLLQMLTVSVLDGNELATEAFAMAVVPQVSQCRPSTYNRLYDHLLKGTPKFDRAEQILIDLQDVFACFGLTCDDIGTVKNQYDINIPECFATDKAPLADYQPSTGVHPIARMDLDVLQLRILTSIGNFNFARFWYMYGRNSPVQRDSDNDPFSFYSAADMATAITRRNAEPWYSEFLKYYNDPNYADTIIRDTLDGKGKWGNAKSVEQRSAVITETTAFMVLYLHLISQIHDAVNSCRGMSNGGEYDLTHPWDEVAALLIGSLEGTQEGGSSDPEDGQFIWGLATRRAFQFQTINGGFAKVNSQLEDLLFAGRGEIDAFDCDAFEGTANHIQELTLVPLMQSVLHFAINNEGLSPTSVSEELALGEVFARAIIPIIQLSDPASANIIEENMIMIFEQGVSPVRDGAQAVADALGSAAIAHGIRCSLLGSTAEIKPCTSSASGFQSSWMASSVVIGLGASLLFVLF